MSQKLNCDVFQRSMDICFAYGWENAALCKYSWHVLQLIFCCQFYVEHAIPFVSYLTSLTYRSRTGTVLLEATSHVNKDECKTLLSYLLLEQVISLLLGMLI